MELRTHEQDSVSILTITGSIRNEQDNESLAGCLDTLRSGGHNHLALDFSSLDYINSRAIGDLMGYYFQVIDRGGSLAAAGAQSMVRTVLNAAGVERFIPVYDTLEEAVSTLSAES
jgi:anti-anti-sigma factor